MCDRESIFLVGRKIEEVSLSCGGRRELEGDIRESPLNLAGVILGKSIIYPARRRSRSDLNDIARRKESVTHRKIACAAHR